MLVSWMPSFLLTLAYKPIFIANSSRGIGFRATRGMRVPIRQRRRRTEKLAGLTVSAGCEIGDLDGGGRIVGLLDRWINC